MKVDFSKKTTFLSSREIQDRKTIHEVIAHFITDNGFTEKKKYAIKPHGKEQNIFSCYNRTKPYEFETICTYIGTGLANRLIKKNPATWRLGQQSVDDKYVILMIEEE